MAYTIEEAGKLLSLSRAHMYRLIDRGDIASIKVGKSRRITSKQLEAYLNVLEQRDCAFSLIVPHGKHRTPGR